MAQPEKYDEAIEDKSAKENRTPQVLDICHQEAKGVSDHEAKAKILVFNYQLLPTVRANNRICHLIGEAQRTETHWADIGSRIRRQNHRHPEHSDQIGRHPLIIQDGWTEPQAIP